MHPDDPAYRQEEPYREDGMYGEDAAYSRNGEYGQDAAYPGNGRYGQYEAYQGNGRYGQDEANQGNGRYSQDEAYGQNGHYGHYGQYGEDTAQLPNGRYGAESAYPQEGSYGGDTRQLPAGRYGSDAGYLADDSYLGSAAEQRNGMYRQDGSYQRGTAFGGDGRYRDDGRYPDDDLYRDGGSYPGDGGYRDEGPYLPDGAYGEDGMFRQAEPAAAMRGAGSGGGRGGRRSKRTRGPRSPRTRLILRVVAAMLATFLLVTGWSLGQALTAPGGGTVAERVAEWARNHGLGPLVTFGEWLTYKPPVKGGKPNVSFNHLGGTSVHRKKHYHGIVPIIPASIGSPAGKPLPGEGVWKAVVSVKHVPAVFKTYVRESKTYSSYYAGIVSMDPRLLRFSLRPGTEDPGYGHWGVPMNIPPGHRLGLIATFNSGFRLYAAGGGFYLNGHYDGKLVRGAASEVYFRNGNMTVGTWGRGALHMGPDIVAVRQNLKLIVVNGQVPRSVDYNVETSWGATLGGGYYVWRSGVGVTKDGRIVYAYGPALNVRDLAALLKRAGCVSAMELDINPDWMSFMYYLAKNHPGNPTPVNLLRNQIQPADRYYALSNRDFTAVFAR